MACVFDDHSAYVQSIFCLQKNEKGETNLFIGKREGEIVYPRGQKNLGLLGLDPCFKPNRSNKTVVKLWLIGSKKNQNIFE